MTDFKPSVDPWDLLIEHNERIQRLELSLQNHKQKIEELIDAVNVNANLQKLNQDSLTKLTEAVLALSNQNLDSLIKTTPFSTGEH